MSISNAGLAQVPVTIRLGSTKTKLRKLCQWHLPRAHYLESWGDARAWDGTAGIIQPLILPLYEGKSLIEVLAIITGDKVPKGTKSSQRTWSRHCPGYEIRPRSGAPKGDRSRLPPGRQFKTADVKSEVCQDFPATEAPGEGIICGSCRTGTLLRWSICQQRLAAGDARPTDQTGVGQRGIDFQEGRRRHRS